VLAQARQQLGTLPALALKHAAEDPAAAAACAQLRGMLAAIDLPVTVEAAPRSQLVAELAREQPNFDLLYWHYDFETEALALWPLFDPKGAAGPNRNFMGYPRDGELEGLFQELHSRSAFNAVQRQAHQLHELMIRQMLLIPLWQLDRHIGVHRSLKPTRLHPLWIFDDVEMWRMEGIRD
jgi:hypothetical protein